MAKNIILILMCLFVFSQIGMSQEGDTPAIVNLMIEASIPASPNIEDINTAKMDLRGAIYKLDLEELKATIFLNKAMTSSQAKVLVAHYSTYPNIEFAMSGNSSEEMLEDLSYSEQKSLLAGSKELAESCRICPNEINILGFKPSSFNQNKDTYNVLDELGIIYNAGYQSGIIYEPGHKDDVWPYKVDGHEFYAVPVSTLEYSGKLMPLDDTYARDNGIDSSQWYDLLVRKLDESSVRSDPLVVSLSTSISGKGEFLSAYERFVDYALSKGAKFVTSNDLVNMSITGIYEIPVVPSNERGNASSECIDCNEEIKTTKENEVTRLINTSVS
jgi:hypothetical protein